MEGLIFGEGLYLEGRFNGGFFVLPVWGAYIWRGLFSEFYGMNTFFVVSILLSGEANKIKQKLKKHPLR